MKSLNILEIIWIPLPKQGFHLITELLQDFMKSLFSQSYCFICTSKWLQLSHRLPLEKRGRETEWWKTRNRIVEVIWLILLVLERCYLHYITPPPGTIKYNYYRIEGRIILFWGKMKHSLTNRFWGNSFSLRKHHYSYNSTNIIRIEHFSFNKIFKNIEFIFYLA